MNLDDDIINKKTNYIMKVIKNIDYKVEKIDKKINEINHIYIQYEFNKNLKLDQPNTYLKFQIDFLFNEKLYFSNIKRYFVKKFLDDLCSISDNIIIILISLENLDIGYLDEKNNLMKKVIKVSKQKETNSSKIIELVNSLLNNLNVSFEFIKLFEKFINVLYNKNKKKNIHSKNLKINLTNKKNHIYLETKKYSEQFNALVFYFHEFSVAINQQLETQKLLHFFVNNKNI